MGNRIIDDKIVVVNSVTKIGLECKNRVVLGASHGAVYASYLAAKEGVRGIILNDAGFSKDNAGVSGGPYCQELDIPYAAMDTMSCCIGNGESAVDDGIISYTNSIAKALGVKIGMPALEAAYKMTEASVSKKVTLEYSEARKELQTLLNQRTIVLMDSVSLVNKSDQGHIIISGSHGGMPEADPISALRQDVFAGFFHDAGGGKNGSGLTRLKPLDDRGIIAATVACMSARIGDAQSIYDDGIISNINVSAKRFGGEVGMSLKKFVNILALK
jgi:hypothetical protein